MKFSTSDAPPLVRIIIAVISAGIACGQFIQAPEYFHAQQFNFENCQAYTRSKYQLLCTLENNLLHAIPTSLLGPIEGISHILLGCLCAYIAVVVLRHPRKSLGK
jgi:hypothetical protein